MVKPSESPAGDRVPLDADGHRGLLAGRLDADTPAHRRKGNSWAGAWWMHLSANSVLIGRITSWCFPVEPAGLKFKSDPEADAQRQCASCKNSANRAILSLTVKEEPRMVVIRFPHRT